MYVLNLLLLIFFSQEVESYNNFDVVSMHNVFVLEFLEDHGHKQTCAPLKSYEGHVSPHSLTLDFNQFGDL